MVDAGVEVFLVNEAAPICVLESSPLVDEASIALSRGRRFRGLIFVGDTPISAFDQDPASPERWL